MDSKHCNNIIVKFSVFALNVGILIFMLCFTVMQGAPDPLNSAFHLTYNMVLNLLRVEEINPEYMLERSFYQFQNYAAIPGLCESKTTQTISWVKVQNFPPKNEI